MMILDVCVFGEFFQLMRSRGMLMKAGSYLLEVNGSNHEQLGREESYPKYFECLTLCWYKPWTFRLQLKVHTVLSFPQAHPYTQNFERIDRFLAKEPTTGRQQPMSGYLLLLFLHLRPEGAWGLLYSKFKVVKPRHKLEESVHPFEARVPENNVWSNPLETPPGQKLNSLITRDPKVLHVQNICLRLQLHRIINAVKQFLSQMSWFCVHCKEHKWIGSGQCPWRFRYISDMKIQTYSWHP